MRSPLVEVFHETLGLCFASTLKDMLGLTVCESVYGLLERNGIPKGEICNRFDDTVTVLTKALGASSRVLVHRTVVEMFRQYSQRAEFFLLGFSKRSIDRLERGQLSLIT